MADRQVTGEPDLVDELDRELTASERRRGVGGAEPAGYQANQVRGTGGGAAIAEDRSSTDRPRPEVPTEAIASAARVPTGQGRDRDDAGSAVSPRPAVPAGGASRPEPASPQDGGRGLASGTAAARQAAQTPLFDEQGAAELRERWSAVQAGFVDEPRRAVEQADGLVAEVMTRLAEGFSGRRSSLESQWSRGADASTEDLRLALQGYRSFFDRLLSL